MADGLCWCASDSKCPHGISAKIPLCWDDMEKIIDDVLQQFDRKTIKKFLKRDVDGNAKSSFNNIMKEAYKSEGLDAALERMGVKKSDEPLRSKTASDKKRIKPSEDLSKSMPINSNQLDFNEPETAGVESQDDGSTLPSQNNLAATTGGSSSLFNKSKSAPRMATAPAAGSGFSRDMLSSSLPKLPPRALPPTAAHANERSVSPPNGPHIPSISGSGPPLKPTPAWGSPVAAHKEAPHSSSAVAAASSTSTGGPNMESLESLKQAMQAPSSSIELPGETTISVGLMRIADCLARRVLPWQAVLCPKAVESLHDLRQTVIQSKHNAFINQMKAKLEQKVMGFIQKKEEEVEIWIDREIKSWNAFMENDETDLTNFIKADLARITNKAVAQDHAYRMRELVIASNIDDHERDSTREQLINFRRIVRSDGNHQGQQTASIEVRALQDSIAKAQSVAHKQISKSNRDLAKRIEESHDWLCSLADNAITASESEEMLKQQYVALDQEKIHALESLHVAMHTYKEQHNAILEAIVVFAGRIHQHASDYLQREQLISRAFLQYLLNIVNGEIKTHSSDQKKNSYAWETKSIADRGHRKELALIHEFNLNISPLDKMVSDFKERMRIQLDHITLKLQSVMNGRENDVNARKAQIHKKLAKHVNKACNARRQRLKDATQVRRDEFNNEEKCISSVNELCSDLRSAIDQIWVKEHLKERRMYEASTGRMERLEKSALIIWNKHSHLAIGLKEEYEDWLEMSRKDRDAKMQEHYVMIERSWQDWRAAFGEDVKALGRSVKAPVHALIQDAFKFDVEVSVERNIDDLTQQSATILDATMTGIERLRRLVNEYISYELQQMDRFTEERKSALLQEWRDYLSILNSAVNRRVGGLKDMEADLEETIRLTILQHEVENSVFEQTSCAKMETFWLEWRSKMFNVAKMLKENQEDYQIAKQAGKSKSRASKKDRALDDLVALSKEETKGDLGNNFNVSKQKALPPIVNNETPDFDTNAYMDDFVDLENTLSDTVRLKRILDEVRPEIYREFTHKITRGLEKVRRDLGEGKRRLVPAYAVARAILMSCDVFWDQAKLAERCVGRISSKGVLLFADGLPTHARSLFCVASTLYTFSMLPLKENKIDCDDAFELFENIKRIFIIGLLTVSLQLGEFGEYFLRSESLWACSTFGVEPPKELIQMSDAKGIDRATVEELRPQGFYSEDPVDLLNSVISLTVELNEVAEMQRQFAQMEAEAEAAAAAASAQRYAESSMHEGNGSVAFDGMSLPSNNQQLMLQQSVQSASMSGGLPPHFSNGSVAGGFNLENDSVITEDNIVMGYTNNNVQDFRDLETRVPLAKQIAKMAYLVPTADICVYVAMLGRPEGSMEMTPHRVCQVVSLWRRTALAIVAAAFDPPSSEYPRINDLIVAHSAQMSGKRRMGSGNISCISPFEAVSNAVDWVTCIKGVPLSVNQALCLLSRGGSCDPWMEDPKQTGRAGRIIYELNEMMDIFSCPIPRSMIHDERIQVAFQPNLFEILKKLDLNYNGQIPVEILRNFIQREDVELTNTQISVIFWSLCRVNDDVVSDSGSVAGGGSTRTFQSGGVAYKPIVQTQFNADPETYMQQFSEDVTRYLESMPSIDTNVIMGCLSQVLVPASAHELVSDAMKLDLSARNAMPTTCCVWLGQRVLSSSEAVTALTVKGGHSKSGALLVGVGEESFNGRGRADKFFVDIRTHVEVDLLTKYPEMCEIRASDRHYGPAGNSPIKPHEDHWKELTMRRLGRMDRLTLSWRDTMLNEWSTSLYQSRQQRYLNRIQIVKQCVGVYHKQYASLKDSIVAERSGLLSRFNAIQSELLALIQNDYNFFAFHASYLERAFRRYEGQFERSMAILTDVLSQYQRHCGTIKRRAISRIAAGSERLKEELEMSCTGMILGYTTGYAQGYFDDLIYRGEVWRNILTELQGKLIVEKESFMTAKDEIDRDITIQVTDRITLDRNRTKGFLEGLSEDTAAILDTVASTRAQYASLQKDANARLILRIEKAVRESRKLRVAAEQQPELEVPVMRDIRVVLDTAYTSCVSIVEQVKETCLKQLATVTPLRKPHEQKMELRVRALDSSWTETEAVLTPMIVDYEREVFKQLGLSKSKCLEMIGIYNETETKALKDKHHFERKGLINAFRKHFREYDLCEAAIFERFNKEVDDTVAEMNKLWGPSRPKFISQGLAELSHIVDDSLVSASNDVISNMSNNPTINDDTTLSRMEVADVFTHSLTQCYKFAQAIPKQFVEEKKSQLIFIEEMSLAKNGDMVRPQVKAVLDLLISGIEIDSDFGKGYDALGKSTAVKTRECYSELSEFVQRYTEAENPVSIPASASLTRARITRRKEEVESLMDAARSHIIADTSRLDVLMAAGEKDIEEWTSLTLQLVENAFHNAELSYLSNLWPTPPATPRLELVPEEEDRVGKLKALLKLNNVDTAAVGALTNPTYEDDFEQAEAERRAKKAQKKQEKEKRRLERQLAAQNDDHLLTAPAHVKPDETRELQQGWFECCSPEGYTYYFNPETDESLWELPAALKVPLHPDDDESVGKIILTPRELLMDSTENMSPAHTNLMRVVPADFTLKVTVDPKVVMGYVAEEARQVALFAIETALDVSAVIRGKKGTDEKTIATLLGNKLNPELLESYNKVEPPPDRDDMSVDSAAQLTKHGRLISDTSSQVDSEMQEMLLEIGMGSETGTTAPSLPAIQEELKLVESYKLNDKEVNRWASLGLGKVEDMPEVASSDDEHGGEMNARERSKRLAEERFQMAKEQAKMAAEEELSIHYENMIEDTNCKKFMASFAAVLEANTATQYEKDCLLELAEVIKPINVVTILQGLRTSWAKLDAIIAETDAKERAKIAMAEQLRTEEGIRRHQTILEHAEDIDEMAEFLHTAGLSITTAKRVATDAICKQISTPKKFAKIWNRGHVTLKEFDIDDDDIEELEIALRKLLVNTSGSNAENNKSFSSNYFPSTQQMQVGYSPFASTNQLPATNSFYLDPALVTEVADDYVDDDSPDNKPNTTESMQYSVDGDRSLANSRSSQRLVKKFSMRNGYKSFKGGWIVGYSEDSHKYYYNTITGASSWHLPEEGMSAEDDHELEHIDEDPDHEEGDAATAAVSYHTLPAHNPNIHQPTSEFAHTYADPHAEYHYDHSQYDHSQYHDPAAYGEEQQQHHDPYQSYESQYSPTHYDENGYPVYGTEGHQEYYQDPHSQAYQYYDEQGQLVTYDPHQQPYYDEHGNYIDPSYYHHDGSGGEYAEQHPQHQEQHDLSDFVVPPKPRTLPVPVKLEVVAYAKKEGVARQMELLNAQDRWQNSLVKSQHFITEQKSLYLDKRQEMFEKVSERVNSRLDAFVEDIKYMQKTIKKELGESNSTERDLRRLFDESHGNVIQAEKLSFVLESMEKFKHTLSLRYDSAFKQISKFAADWELIRQELNQVGDLYDEGVAANLDQCRLACEHNAKVFAYDQLKAAAAMKKQEMKLLRRSLHQVLLSDTKEIEEARDVQRAQHLQYYRDRELTREKVKRDMGGKGWSKTIEAEVVAQGFPPLDPVTEVGPEEDFVMSYMLTQLEMEQSLAADYDSITEASKNMAIDLQNGIRDFDLVEKKNIIEEGSWFNKHRETLERHEAALNVTLTKVRNRVNEGYKVLQAKIEALDFDVERAAEEELFQNTHDDA